RGNYNIKLGGDVPPINDVRDTKHYRGIIYQVDINTGEVLNQAASAGEMAKRTGLYQSRISEILRGVKSRYKNYFFTRNLHTWKTDREELLEKFFQDRLKLSKERSGVGRSVGVSAFNTDGSLFKSFSSTQEALRFFNKSPRAGKTIYNSIDY